MKKRNRDGGASGIPPLSDERLLIEALRYEGHIAPDTDEEALRLIERLAESAIQLPPALEDIDALTDRVLSGKVQLPRAGEFAPETEQARSLRRAARNGTSISSEVEEAMRRAREAGDSE